MDETTTPLILESRLQRRESTSARTKGEASGYEGDDEERERIRERPHRRFDKLYKRTHSSRSQAVFFDGADINNVEGSGNKGGEADVEVSRDYVVVERRAEKPKEQETATTHHTDPLGHGEDNDGQGDSDSSAAPSLFSVQSYASSVESVETRRHMTEQLADMLFDRGTREKYVHAVAKLDPEKFARQHNKLLKHYLDDLRSTADDAIALSALRALRSKSQRQRVTELIAEMASGRVAKSDPRVRQQREKKISDRIQRTQARSKGKERALENEDSSESDDDDGGGTSDMYDYLGHIIDFFLKGQPFTNLETRLEYMVNVPESITEVLDMGDVHKLTVYLESYFRDAATGEYEWIEDLKEVCPRSEIAQLLYERKYDSPWIYFEPSPNYPGTPEQGITHGHHIADCAHRLPHPSPPGAKGPTNLSQDELKEVKQALEELCGVAGIAPRSRDLSEWPGTAAFGENDDTSVKIHYHSAGRERTDILASVFDILDRIRLAIGMLQSLKLICSSFTVLAIPTPDEGKDLGTMVRLVPISVDLIWSLHNCVHPINRNVSYALKGTPKQALHKVFGWGPAMRSRVDAMDDVYALALTVQVLTVGLLSYSQAHIGPLQPFFLDKPLHRIDLLGTERNDEQESLSWVMASLVEPSCLGGMTHGPVMAFRFSHFSDTEDGGGTRQYDVCSKPADILDTWGPGELVLRAGSFQVPMAIRVGGGFISPPPDKDGVVSIPSGYTTPASSDDEDSAPPPKKDRSALKYHWGRVPQISDTSPRLDLKKNIIVAGSVRVNEGCKIDEAKCWEASYTYFEELGTYRSYSQVTEHQVGLQGGPDNFAFTMTKVWGKCPGKTIKARYLERGNDDLISFLQFFFGVRVSFCTGVAQRVRLSQLVADLLPSFASALTNGRERGWLAELESEEHDIVGRFRGAHDALLAWIASLSGDLYHFVTTLVRWILTTLADTGLSPGNGTEFVVAWPHKKGIVSKGFRIPLNEGNKWAAMLADSDDCATFAYVTSTCLVATGGQSPSSSSSVCRGPMPIWTDTITLLETAVFCPASKTPSSWSLTAEQAYFFQKLDNNLFWVKARVIPPQGSSITTSGTSSNSTVGGGAAGKDGSVLVRLVSSKSIPQDFRQRFLVREGRKKERRLREKDLESVWSRAVVVLPGR